MATPICNARVRNVLTGVVLALGISALVAPDLMAQEARRPGGGEGRQMDGGGRGAGGGRPEGAARPGGERPAGGEGRRTRGDDGGEADSSGAAPAAMQFGAAPVRGSQNATVAAPAVAPVAAQTPQQNGWLNEIAELEARLALIEKRNELDERMIDSQLKLMEKRAELDSLARSELDVRLLDSQIQRRQKRSELDTLLRENTDATLAYLPSVVSIIGTKNKYQAQLYFPTGRISYARKGELIAPGVRVTEISANGIEVSMVLGDSAQPQQVPLNFVSLPERRGESEQSDDHPSFGDVMQRMFQNRMGGAGAGGAAPRPAAAVRGN